MITADRLKRRLRLRDLDTLMAVVQAGGMRKAAEVLHLSQGAVSKAVAELESALGVRLLERTAKGVEATVYGQALLRRGRVIFDELRQGVNELNFLAEPGVGELALGAGESLAASVVPAVMDRIHRQHPRVTFKVESGDPPVLLDHFLRLRQCELVMLRPWQPITDPDIDSEPLFNERIAVVAGSQSAWARRRKLTLAELMVSAPPLSPRGGPRNPIRPVLPQWRGRRYRRRAAGAMETTHVVGYPQACTFEQM